MKFIEKFSGLTGCNTVEDWRNQIFKLGRELGYEQTLLAIFPDRNTPVEAEFAFLHSNYSPDWRNKYDELKLGLVDPTVSHCANKSTPLIWTPGIFSIRRQKEMYEEASSYGLRSGVTLPIHGARGELGVLCFVNDTKPDRHFHREAHRTLPELSYFRDCVFETSRRFMRQSAPSETLPYITFRELECLKWCAAGKSSSDTAQILNCSIAAVNFHFASLRTKFNVSTRHQVVIKALRYGLIHP